MWKAAIPKTAYDETQKSLVTLLWEAQQGDALIDTQRCLLVDKANCPAKQFVASNWAILAGILRYKGRIYVPNSAPVSAEILLKNHDNLHAGHFRAHKTLELLQCKYFWPRMAGDVKRYVRDCKTCNSTKAARCKPYGLLQLLLALSGPWKDITMNFITGIPSSLRVDGKAYDAICYGFRSKWSSGKFHHVLKLFMAIVNIRMRGLVGHNTW